MRVRMAIVAIVLLVVPVGCGGSVQEPASTGTGTTVEPTRQTSPETPTTEAPGAVPVVIDTDMSIEGMMSILYLLERPEIEVLAITVSGTGLVHCDPGVSQALGLLALSDAEGVPVACGPEQPLDGMNAFPTSWRVAADEGHGLDLSSSESPSELTASELLVSVIMDSAEPVLVYADGPSTNLAAALRLEPGLADRIEMLYMMAGVIEAAGNTVRNPGAEWNVWIDPVAADEVLRSGVPITLVPLDATGQVPFHVFHRAALEAHQATPASRAVMTMLAGSPQLSSGELYFWDQLTAAVLIDESYVTLEQMDIEVTVDEDRSVAGTTVIAESGSPIRVATAVDAERFERDFLSAIAGEDVGPISIDTDFSVSFDGEAWESDMAAAVIAGRYTVQLSNDGEGFAVLVFGWLLGDATVEDLDAWNKIEQPPFYEVGSFVSADSGATVVAEIELAGSERYVVVGLDVVADDSERLAVVEVTEPWGPGPP